MRRAAAIVMLVPLLTACTVTWEKPGASPQDYSKDSYECQRDMRQSGYYGSGLVGNLNMEAFGEQCMEAHGWRKAK